MTGFEAFQLFQAIKLHFTTDSYDYFKYGGKTRFKLEHFESRKDKYFFLKLSRKYRTKEAMIFFLVSLFVEKDYKWVGDLVTQEAEDKYLEKQRVFQSLTYIFTNDCQRLLEIVENPNQLFKTDGDIPLLIHQMNLREIHLETVCILEKILGFTENLNKIINDDLLWPPIYRRIIKYNRFIEIDVDSFKTILQKLL